MPTTAYNKAIGLLARREHSCKELRDKLLHKGHSHAEIEEAIARLQEHNLVSDARYANAYVHARRQRGFGPERIAQELAQAGVESSLIESTLAAIDEQTWLDHLATLHHKRFGGEQPADFPTRAKQMNYLQYRGFSPALLRRLFADI